MSAFPFILHIITNCSIHSHYPFLSDPYQILLNQFFDILSFPVNSFGNQNDFNPIYTFSHSILSNSILANHVLFNSLLFIKSLSKFRFSNPNLFNPIWSNPFQTNHLKSVPFEFNTLLSSWSKLILFKPSFPMQVNSLLSNLLLSNPIQPNSYNKRKSFPILYWSIKSLTIKLFPVKIFPTETFPI